MEQQKSAAPSPSKAKSRRAPSRLFAGPRQAGGHRRPRRGVEPARRHRPQPERRDAVAVCERAEGGRAAALFVRMNRFSAREAITLEKTGFVAMYSPFDMGWRQRQRERLEAQKLRVGGTFQPPSATDAKATVGVNYYLNSPDAETIEAERRYIQEKAARNMQAFHRKLRAQQHND